MAAIAEYYCGTPDLTRGERAGLNSSTSGYAGDELTRLHESYRTPGAISNVPPQVQTKRFWSRGQLIEVQFWSQESRLPAWFNPTLQGLTDLITLEPNWDSYGARAIDVNTVNLAFDYLATVMGADMRPPSVVPLSVGGVQLEWHNKGRDLELVFEPSGEATLYYYDSATEEEREEPLTDLTPVQALLARVA